ncbi:adenylate/guanylate cyclase domain-containing protein [Singulisphaera acidiphila]|uniref:Family 3 adenylate cyclase n=1 Tax=Singulisphaera acidiphila (strain ATCC BAA-1392 / DSM 18658 / VKM B-2454 / MOB10) TaxID=886293 RepID=L0DJW5_SINAD|nr:adenylate/guanylate cyclase domain-containing protein [Singulisphaera acidiphila]AGA29128.1 family 3 adenylate cyclase [Singulisphaera acidiphila DSM 18658]
MLRISLTYKNAQTQFAHESGPIEFGRGPQRDVPRRVLLDPSVSGDQLRIEEGPLRRLRIQNLSKRFPVWLPGGQMIVPGGQCEVALPTRLTIGETLLKAEPGTESGEGTYFESMRTVERPFRPGESNFLTGLPKEEGIDAATLARWFEAVVSVQRASVSSGEFYKQTARAVVELIGLDRGLVILKRGNEWEVIAHHDADSSGTTGTGFSRGVLNRVCQDKRTFYQDLADDSPSASLLEISAVVAAPILNDDGEVIGIVYGARLLKPGALKLAIRPLEAQLVQVLATAVEAGLARAESEAQASRRRIQFEQFFSTELSRELDRDPSLLEGREREITILFSDIRGFSRVSEKLTPGETCQLAGDVMERLTVRVLEFKGVVVGYSGDGMLAMWNAPADQPDHAILACKAAIAMFAELPALDDLWRERIGGPLGIGIGINTGRALVGNTGSRTKFMYGPQGHAVNLASRVEGATKHLGVPVLMTGSTHEKLRGQLPARKLCRVRVAGIDGAADLYELHTGSVDAAWGSLCNAYETALSHYEQGRFAEACRTLYPLISGPEGQYDLPTLTLVGRCIECLKSPHKSFDPVIELVQK